MVAEDVTVLTPYMIVECPMTIVEQQNMFENQMERFREPDIECMVNVS